MQRAWFTLKVQQAGLKRDWQPLAVLWLANPPRLRLRPLTMLQMGTLSDVNRLSIPVNNRGELYMTLFSRTVVRPIFRVPPVVAVVRSGGTTLAWSCLKRLLAPGRGLVTVSSLQYVVALGYVRSLKLKCPVEGAQGRKNRGMFLPSGVTHFVGAMMSTNNVLLLVLRVNVFRVLSRVKAQLLAMVILLSGSLLYPMAFWTGWVEIVA